MKLQRIFNFGKVPHAFARNITAFCLLLGLFAVACQSSTQTGSQSANNLSLVTTQSTNSQTGDTETRDTETSDILEPVQNSDRVRLITHDSFAISESVLEEFTNQTGIQVELFKATDVGELVAQVILSKDNPVADVIYGIDNTFLANALTADIFIPYRPQLADRVDESLLAGEDWVVTPVDYGDVCINYWADAFAEDPPNSMDDLTDERYRGTFVTQHPESSSPGLAFLLATIAKYGDNTARDNNTRDNTSNDTPASYGWQDYWRDLRANDLLVVSNWSSAYYGEFSAGGGERPIVTSYASSPVAEVVFAAPPVDSPPTKVVLDSCFRQVEYAGILKNTDRLAASQLLMDFLLTAEFQEDIPLNMFVFPANTDAQLPEPFRAHAQIPTQALTLSLSEIAENRDRWIDEWIEIVLR